MSVSLDDIWSEPIAKSPSPRRQSEHLDNSPRPTKRPRSSLFLDGSDDELPIARPQIPSRPEIDSLFDNIEDPTDDADEIPAFDLEAYRREAGRRAAQADPPRLTPRAVQSSSPPREDANTEGNIKEKPGRDEKKERKPIPKLDETRLLGRDGLPALVQQTKDFKPKGKGHELNDLNRLFSIYQFWAHRMYPKIQFSDTVDRIEKLCHHKRMHVALSVWRDNAKGTINGIEVGNGVDVDHPSDREDDVAADSPLPASPSASRAAVSGSFASYPPTSPSEIVTDDDVFDIDALLVQEEEMVNEVARPHPHSGASSSGHSLTFSDGVDDEAMWSELHQHETAFDDPSPHPSALARVAPLNTQSNNSGPQRDDDEMWDVLDELEKDATRMSSGDAVHNTGKIVEAGSQKTGMDERAVAEDDDLEEMYI